MKRWASENSSVIELKNRLETSFKNGKNSINDHETFFEVIRKYISQVQNCPTEKLKTLWVIKIETERKASQSRPTTDIKIPDRENWHKTTGQAHESNETGINETIQLIKQN